MPSVVRFSFAYPPEEGVRQAQGLLEVGADDITFDELVTAFSEFALMMGFSHETVTRRLDLDGAVERAIHIYTH